MRSLSIASEPPLLSPINIADQSIVHPAHVTIQLIV